MISALNQTLNITNVCLVPFFILAGIASNILNVIVFNKQGYDTSVINITLTALAVSDVGSLVTLAAHILIKAPPFVEANLSISIMDLDLMVAQIPQNYFSRVGACVTALASFDRCLCVVFPLTFKRFVTKRSVTAMNMFIFLIISITNLLPIYICFYLDWQFSEALNKTIISQLTRESFAFFVYDFYNPMDLYSLYTCILFITICNLLVSIYLKKYSMKRKSISGTGNTSSTLLRKEKRVTVMLLMTSLLFVVCMVPKSVSYSVKNSVRFLPDIVTSLYHVSVLTEALSANTNFIVYYTISSKYKKTFRQMFQSSKPVQ